MKKPKTNAEHFPTYLGKARGFLRYCRAHTCRSCPLFDGDFHSRLCALRWLSATFAPIQGKERADIDQGDLFAEEGE
jgi:hypothetical protein